MKLHNVMVVLLPLPLPLVNLLSSLGVEEHKVGLVGSKGEYPHHHWLHLASVRSTLLKVEEAF